MLQGNKSQLEATKEEGLAGVCGDQASPPLPPPSAFLGENSMSRRRSEDSSATQVLVSLLLVRLRRQGLCSITSHPALLPF